MLGIYWSKVPLRVSLSTAVVLALCLLVPSGGPAAAQAEAPVAPVRVLTYNVTQPSLNFDKYPGRTWDVRFPRHVELINAADPDILGLQEVSGCSVSNCGEKIIAADHFRQAFADEYDAYPAASTSGSPKMILYKRDRFTQIRAGYRNYTAVRTPNVGEHNSCDPRLSTGENGSYALKWVLLEEKTTGQRYFVVNTHLHFQKQCWWIRDQSAQQLKDEIYEENTDQAPVIVTGDMNSQTASCDPIPETENYKPGSTLAIISAPSYWFNLKIEAPGPDCTPTFNAGWDASRTNDSARFDYIAMTTDLTVTSRTIDKRLVPGKPYSPSDHYAMFVDLQLN